MSDIAEYRRQLDSVEWLERFTAAQGLSAYARQPEIRALLLGLSHDPDHRVRRLVAMLLTKAPGDGASET